MNIDHSWLLKWSRRLASVTTTQVVSQLLNGIVAVVLIRTLSKPEYAWFTIASSISAILNNVIDGGIATAVTSAGGEVWNDRKKFSALVASALSLLRRTAFVSTGFVAPLLIWLLWEKQASVPTIAVLAVLVIAPQWAATRTTILAATNRLHSRILQLQVAELAGAFTRSGVTLIPAALGFINVYIAVGAVALACLVQLFLVKMQVAPLLDFPADAEDQGKFRGRIVSVMRCMYPNVLFNCVQGQLGTGILSVMGTTSQLADLGALSRLSFVANFLSAPLSFIIAPAFARCQDLQRLVRLFSGVLAGYLLIFGGFIALVVWQADLVLKLFGAKYAHLHYELLLVAVSVAVGFINQLFWSLNYARGWVRAVWVNIPLTLAAQVVAVVIFDMRTVEGVAKLMITTFSATLVLGMVVCSAGFRSWQHRHSH